MTDKPMTWLRRKPSLMGNISAGRISGPHPHLANSLEWQSCHSVRALAFGRVIPETVFATAYYDGFRQFASSSPCKFEVLINLEIRPNLKRLSVLPILSISISSTIET